MLIGSLCMVSEHIYDNDDCGVFTSHLLRSSHQVCLTMVMSWGTFSDYLRLPTRSVTHA